MMDPMTKLWFGKLAEERRREMQEPNHTIFSLVLFSVAESFASGINVFSHYITVFLHAAGLRDDSPEKTVTTEEVAIIIQWVLVCFICYKMITFTILLATVSLRWLCRLLKVGAALLVLFLILNGQSVSRETMITRLVCAGCVCIVMWMWPRGDRIMADQVDHLQGQLSILENRVRELEGRRRRSALLCCSLKSLLCFVGVIALVFYSVIYHPGYSQNPFQQSYE